MTPTGDIAVVCAHFNFGNFTNPRRNLLRFIRYVHSFGIKCYGVELYKEGQDPLTTSFPTWKQIKATDRHTLWQKETLWNLAEKLVPSHIQKIACLDADLMFTSSKWARKLSESLDRHKVVQPFSKAYATDKYGKVTQSTESAGFNKGLHPATSHPGYGMAFQRTLWTEGPGIFDCAIGGNGDRFLIHGSLSENPIQTMLAQDIDAPGPIVPAFIFEWYSKWLTKYREWLGEDRLTCIPVEVFHEYHGSYNGRQYRSRRNLVKTLNEKELIRDENGLWKWSKYADELRIDAFKNYFKNRREDE